MKIYFQLLPEQAKQSTVLVYKSIREMSKWYLYEGGTNLRRVSLQVFLKQSDTPRGKQAKHLHPQLYRLLLV